MATKRTINGTKFNISQIVDEAIAAVDATPPNTEKARQELSRLGHRNPADELVIRYAREAAILETLARVTHANFAGQVGKISFNSRESTIRDVESYLNRRIGGQHARWTANHR